MLFFYVYYQVEFSSFVNYLFTFVLYFPFGSYHDVLAGPNDMYVLPPGVRQLISINFGLPFM